jgi:pyridoxine kinase
VQYRRFASAEIVRLLAFLSQVVSGHVGAGAAVLPLQRLGFEVMHIPTVLLAHHPGHGAFRGKLLPAEQLQELVEGLAAISALAAVDGVLSGYLGTAANGAVMLDALARARAGNAAVRYLCDPVLGDADRGLYVRPEVAEFLKHQAVPAADLVTPNRFELEWLTDSTVASLEDALAACDALRARGPKCVICTSLDRDTTVVETLAVDDSGAWLVATPKLAPVPNGSGDLFAALFLGQRLLGRPVPNALVRAVTATYGVLQQSVGAAEMRLIEAQAAFTDPPARFAAAKVR